MNICFGLILILEFETDNIYVPKSNPIERRQKHFYFYYYLLQLCAAQVKPNL